MFGTTTTIGGHLSEPAWRVERVESGSVRGQPGVGGGWGGGGWEDGWGCVAEGVRGCVRGGGERG